MVSWQFQELTCSAAYVRHLEVNESSQQLATCIGRLLATLPCYKMTKYESTEVKNLAEADVQF